ncbi:GntR family transcriptional regulator [Vibrio algarum]|uniref:GntR family transcriptional regulator n=1 Tax=Vibrio algarum TaxID=3020714 RepID=A0ABT4YU74_9VIBR|nr:GntR family transcriptional regulator [Vibrio sp. KJ40-1]MDB1124922.1 GntR family transcriptional regulator [Vibrio sp. KJ40-1]
MKLSEQAYVQLKTMILKNKFHINQRFLVDEMVEICGFSRTPVREALLRLQEDGLIEITPRHGVKICALSKKDIIELYEIMGYLEVTAIDLCISKGLTDEQIATLRSYMSQMEQALHDDDIEKWGEIDKIFHETIFEYTENSRLIETARKYSEQGRRCKDIVLKIRPKPWDSIEEHNLIVDTIISRDILKARNTHLEHWRQVSKQFVGFLENYNFLDN